VGPTRLKIGLNLPTWPDRRGQPTSWDTMRALAHAAEEAGVDTIWAPDHLLRRSSDGTSVGFQESWTILSAVAEATRRVEIGPFVANTSFRQPALLAKMAATLDEVSGGRLVLALGSGDPARDPSFSGFGYPTESPVGRFEEAVEIVARLLRGESIDFAGRFYRTEGAVLVPAGPRAGGPPIWVAARGARTFAIAALWADAVNLNAFLSDPDAVATAFAPAVAACESIGRDPASLAWTGYARVSFAPPATTHAPAGPGTGATIRGTVDEIASRLHGLHQAGVRHLTCYVDPGDSPSPLPALETEGLERFVPVLEHLRRREAGGAAAD